MPGFGPAPVVDCGSLGHLGAPASYKIQKAVAKLQSNMDKVTKFIPSWVKVAVALALGLGTMIGWKRIVVTVGEKIGKEHLTYAQGASAELVAMATILAADRMGLPVSTTHVIFAFGLNLLLRFGVKVDALTWRTLLVSGPSWRRSSGRVVARILGVIGDVDRFHGGQRLRAVDPRGVCQVPQKARA